jgi:hypothetical protein
MAAWFDGWVAAACGQEPGLASEAGAYRDRRLAQAALTLGATPWQAFRRITFPLIPPGVLSGFLFAAVLGGFLVENGNPLVLFQPAELLIVGGAAAGIVMVANPPSVMRKMWRGSLAAFRPPSRTPQVFLRNMRMLYEIFTFIQRAGIMEFEQDVEDPPSSRIFSNHPDFLQDQPTRDFVCESLRMLVVGDVMLDRYWFGDNNRDDSWDAVWDVKVTQDSTGWIADFRIPFSQLRFNPSQATTFGFAVSRQIGRLNETSTWPLLARSANGYVSSFGDLAGLSMNGSPKRLEMVPYTVGQLNAQPTEGNPLIKGKAPSGAFGLDMKYALTPGLTLTTTINPDFGQVEADPAVVNLSAFETFFSERRPFFIEGSGTFRFDSDCWNGPCSLFYSRRVGRSPQGSDNLPSGDAIYTDYAPQTTILGAAKLTGRIGKFSVGVLNAVTQEEQATVLDGTRKFDQPVEPLTGIEKKLTVHPAWPSFTSARGKAIHTKPPARSGSPRQGAEPLVLVAHRWATGRSTYVRTAKPGTTRIRVMLTVSDISRM